MLFKLNYLLQKRNKKSKRRITLKSKAEAAAICLGNYFKVLFVLMALKQLLTPYF